MIQNYCKSNNITEAELIVYVDELSCGYLLSGLHSELDEFIKFCSDRRITVKEFFGTTTPFCLMWIKQRMLSIELQQTNYNP